MSFRIWCQDKWLMMMRTKPRYISVLGRKRSSVSSAPKLSSRESKCGNKFGAFLSVITMLCSVSYGTLLVLSKNIESSSLATYLVSLAIAGIIAITSGLCLAEYINNQSSLHLLSPEVSSIYSCCYQYSSEVLAFFIGWIWIMSQTAAISAVCKVFAVYINEWTNDIPRKFLENIFFDYATDVPSLIIVLFFILFILTGFAETTVWYIIFVPVAFLVISAMYIINLINNGNVKSIVDKLNFGDILGVNEVLSKSTLCILFFSGPQSLLRTPVTQIRKKTTAVLGPLNVINLIIALAFIMSTALSNTSITDSSSLSSNTSITDSPSLSSSNTLELASNILYAIGLCSIGLEAFYPLHYIVEDMSSDGLLFRSFSKKWKPFCFPVPATSVHVLSFVLIGLTSVFIPLLQVLYLVAAFPLLIGSTIPYLVLIQRYKVNSSWQYEPMFHTVGKSFPSERSRKKNEEFQYSHVGFDVTEDCDLSTTCMDENPSESTSSDTDIDSVVEQYREQTAVANLKTLDGSVNCSSVPQPTPSTSFRANCCIVLLMITSFSVSIVLNVCNLKDHYSVVIIVLLSILFSVILLSLLICLPQNKTLSRNKECCQKIPTMPWIPGMALMMSCSLLVHVLITTWKVCIGCLIMGFLLYFLYGIRSSTAANSFYNMRSTHINLRPLPSYGNNCVSQIIPAQQKLMKLKKHKKLRTGNI